VKTDHKPASKLRFLNHLREQFTPVGKTVANKRKLMSDKLSVERLCRSKLINRIAKVFASLKY